MAFQNGLNLDATELRLGPPGLDENKLQDQQLPQSIRINKRPLLLPESNQSSSGSNISVSSDATLDTPPPSKYVSVFLFSFSCNS